MIKTESCSDLISIQDLSTEQIVQLLALTNQLKQTPQHSYLQHKILGCAFFEASTRTRLSFEAAMHRLGGNVIGFSNSNETSLKKGESLQDTVRMMAGYCDAIVIRHPKEGAARLAADTIDVPVINAGDGGHEHPTQTLLDLFSIQECQGRLNELNIGLIGDLKQGRAVHSLALASVHFGCRLYFISPDSLEMPANICRFLSEKGIQFSMHRSLREILPKLDLLYVTRIQQERFKNPAEYEAVKNCYQVTPDSLKGAKESMRILHPLPRVEELDSAVDNTPHAYYFQQAANGLFVRQAILATHLRNHHAK